MPVLSIHIVRRYGPVGGMENYVYQLSHALVRAQQPVLVLCERDERSEQEKDKDSLELRNHISNDLSCNPDGSWQCKLTVVELGNSYKKPRWKAQWSFSQRVSEYFEQKTELCSQAIIHSHERTAEHDVTTFHGPPFADRKRRLLDGLSPRIRMWAKLEEQELMGESVMVVLPNSPLIANKLVYFYPSVADKIREPAYPGVDPLFSKIQKQSEGNVIGFLGREWKRKGLDIACSIVEQVREQNPEVHLLVAGCDIKEIEPLFAHWPKEAYTLMGWVEPQSFLAQINVLLHPARAEPFGMVIAEANAATIPVIVSDQCGAAALVTKSQGQVCRLPNQVDNKSLGKKSRDMSSIAPWVEACHAELARSAPVESMNLSWDALAQQHIQLYQELKIKKASI